MLYRVSTRSGSRFQRQGGGGAEKTPAGDYSVNTRRYRKRAGVARIQVQVPPRLAGTGTMFSPSQEEVYTSTNLDGYT
jgi:hypothetical protein